MMLINAAITLPYGFNDPALAEFLCRSWYAAASATYAALTIICGPRLNKGVNLITASAVLVIGLLYFTDVFIAGALIKYTAFGWRLDMITRDPGEYYTAWLVIILVLAALQVALLIARMTCKSDGRDRTVAQWLMMGLATSYIATGFLAAEMTNPLPAFNAQPLISICCLVFCEVVAYTFRNRKLRPVHSGALEFDLALVISIGRVLSDVEKSNAELKSHLAAAGLLGVRAGPYIARKGQAVFLGDIQRLTWCDKLDFEVERILQQWPQPRIKIFH